jgi:hypothetical protein
VEEFDQLPHHHLLPDSIAYFSTRFSPLLLALGGLVQGPSGVLIDSF